MEASGNPRGGLEPRSSNQPRLASHLLSLKRKGLNLRRLSRRKSGLADDRYVHVVFFLLETRKGLRALRTPRLQPFLAERLIQRLVRDHRLNRRVELCDDV